MFILSLWGWMDTIDFYCAQLCVLPTRSYSTEYTIILTLSMHMCTEYILARPCGTNARSTSTLQKFTIKI